MQPIQCFRCGTKTDTKDPQGKTSENRGRTVYRIAGKCAVCGAGKSVIVKEAEFKRLQEGGFLPALLGLAAPIVGAVASHFIEKKLKGSGNAR